MLDYSARRMGVRVYFRELADLSSLCCGSVLQRTYMRHLLCVCTAADVSAWCCQRDWLSGCVCCVVWEVQAGCLHPAPVLAWMSSDAQLLTHAVTDNVLLNGGHSLQSGGG
jgi:hypothetical protein